MESGEERGGSTAYVLLLTLVAALGGLLFGYDTAVISGAIGFLETHFHLGAGWKAWMASSALVGCAGRRDGGVAERPARPEEDVGYFRAAVPDFGGRHGATPRPAGLRHLSDHRRAGHRGRLDEHPRCTSRKSRRAQPRTPGLGQPVRHCLRHFAGLLHQLPDRHLRRQVDKAAEVAVAATASWNVEYGWRWMFGSGALPAGLFLVLLLLVPESPRWLTKQGRRGEALDILTRVGGRDPRHRRTGRHRRRHPA